MQSTMMSMPLSLNHLLERAGTIFPEVEVVTRRPDKSIHRYTYADFHQRARALAAALQKLGVQPGDRVGTLMWNHYAHLETYFAVPAVGAVVHTLNLRLAPDDIAWIANHAEDRYLIVDDVLWPLAKQFIDQTHFEKIIVFGFGGTGNPEGTLDYETLIAGGVPDNFSYVDVPEDAPCGMCYTSGTTGRPKGVVYSHRSTMLHSLVMGLPDSGNISMRETVLPVVPMFHVGAWGIPYICAMTGAKLVFPGPHMDAESLLDLFEQEKVSMAAGVPTIWMGIMQALEKEPKRWHTQPDMRMIVGGSAVPAAMVKAFDRFDMHIISAWGMTEMSPLGTIAKLKPALTQRPYDQQVAYRIKAGVPAPFVDVRIHSDEGIQPWDGKSVGELQVRGPWITGSYYKLDKNNSFTKDGWFGTGDVACITPEGYVQITDRTKDLVKSGGEWISSVELENDIMAHPAVQEAAVIAHPHPKWGERPLACVVKKQGAQVTAEELTAHLAKTFSKMWLPDDYVFIDAIPRTSTGKFQKLVLREQFKDWQWGSGS